MYGDTHVEPAPLFDPERGGPPADAWDLFFPVPLSLSLVADAFAVNAMACELELLRGVCVELAGQLVTTVQRQGGYVAGGHGGRAVPGRLELTAVVEDHVPGLDTMRLHTHVYVGRTALALETGERHPVEAGELAQAADFAWRGYLTQLVNRTTDVLGFVWGSLPDHASGDQEIVEPPMAELIAGLKLGVCPGVDGPREQIRADARWRAHVEKFARDEAAERRARS